MNKLLSPEKTNTRNEVLEFARRTRRNLEFIEHAATTNPTAVHVVTQLSVSLLGLVVFPKEKMLLTQAESKSIIEMTSEGWPTWKITKDNEKKPTATLADIIRHVRNATSHGRLTFTSDSPRLEEVGIIIVDKHPQEREPYWRAEIRADDLREFCLHFITFIEETIN